MPVTRRTLVLAGGASLAAPATIRAQTTSAPIRIGEINSYTAIPAFTVPYRMGWQLAVEQINAAGGVLGRKLEVVSHDDAGKPPDAVRLAGALLDESRVDLLAGGFLSNVGLAISDFAKQRRRLFVASEPLTDALVWEQGHRYCFRLRPSTYMQVAMLVDDAVKLGAKRWVTVSPNYEYGQSLVKWFKLLMAQRQPGVEFVAEQWPALGRIDAGATVTALLQARPDAIFNGTFGADLTNFVRQGNTRGLFEKRGVVSVLTGEPEYLEPLGDETPQGWIVTGWPVDAVTDPTSRAFIDAYRGKFGELPKMGSVVGHAMITAIAGGIAKSGSVETEAMADGFKGATFPTPFGPALWRAQDNQGTLGTYVGRTALRGGKGVMVDWRYVDGAAAMPSDEEVRKMRPG